MKKILIIFGDGTQEMMDASLRLERQAQSLNFFDDIINANLEYLKNFCKDDFYRNKDFISIDNRGLGFWIWKPIIIKNILYCCNEGDVIFYADSGCEIFEEGRSSLINIIELAVEKGAVFFKLPYTESQWTKNDLIIHPLINVRYPRAINQIQATYFALANNSKSRKLVEDWLLLSEINNYHYIDDSFSKTINYPEFREHRHDQSILSCLVHTHDIYCQEVAYHFERNRYFFKSPYLKHFIHPLRNKSSTSIIMGGYINSIYIRLLFLLLFYLDKIRIYLQTSFIFYWNYLYYYVIVKKG